MFLRAAIAAEPRPVEVRLTRPERGEVVRYVALPGNVRANQQATLYAKVPGYLKSLAVDKGDRVEVGQALGEIEVPELTADQSRYRAELKVAETELRRLREARERAPDLVVPLAVDEAEAKLEIARAQLERIQTLLDYAHLTAPFAGIVTARFVDPGAFIPSATSGSSAQTAAVVTIMDFATVRVQWAVPEMETPKVRIGQPVRVVAGSLPERMFEGQVSRYGYALDELTRSMQVEADLPNPDALLRPGMYVTVQVGLEKHSDALTVPSETLVAEKANLFVFVAQGDRARKNAVKVGFNDGSRAEILSGLKGDEAVILVGKLPLVDGTPIRATEAR
jgi:RND family efflux transporter MFP subunit